MGEVLGAMMTILLPLISLAIGAVAPAVEPAREVVTSPRVAQVRLAETLADADAIHAITARAHTVTFTIDRGDDTVRVVARTRKSGEVIALEVAPVGPARGDLGSLSWLSPELAEASAVTRLVIDEDGAIEIVTSDDRSYMAIPGRGSGGNTAVEARWMAAWDHTET